MNHLHAKIYKNLINFQSQINPNLTHTLFIHSKTLIALKFWQNGIMVKPSFNLKSFLWLVDNPQAILLTLSIKFDSTQ